MLRIIIAGSRDFNNYELLDKEVSSILNSMVNIPMEEMEIVSGTARGADRLGEKYARENGFKLTKMPANWEKDSIAAGVIRNRKMAEYSAPDGVLIAFWDQKSRGTSNMIKEAERVGLKVHIINY